MNTELYMAAGVCASGDLAVSDPAVDVGLAVILDNILGTFVYDVPVGGPAVESVVSDPLDVFKFDEAGNRIPATQEDRDEANRWLVRNRPDLCPEWKLREYGEAAKLNVEQV